MILIEIYLIDILLINIWHSLLNEMKEYDVANDIGKEINPFDEEYSAVLPVIWSVLILLSFMGSEGYFLIREESEI